MKFYGHRYKISRVGTFFVAVIRGESCFAKNAFEDTENPPPANQNSTSGERISRGNIRDIEKKFGLF